MRTLSSATLPRMRNPPSRSAAIPGSGVEARRSQFVVGARALSPRSFAQRSISVMPMVTVPHRWRICPESAPMPWQRSSITNAASPGSSGWASADSTVGLKGGSSIAVAAGIKYWPTCCARTRTRVAMLVSWKIKRWPKLDSEPRCSITTRRPSHAVLKLSPHQRSGLLVWLHCKDFIRRSLY